MDSDDWIDIHMYEEMIKSNLYQNCDVIRSGYMVHDGQKLISENNQVFEKDYVVNMKKDRDYIIEKYCNQEFSSAIWSMLIKRDTMMKCYPLDESVFMGEDMLFVVKLFHECDSILFLKQKYYYYFYNENTLSRNFSRAYSNIDDMYSWQKKIYKILEEYNNFTAENKENFSRLILVTLLQFPKTYSKNAEIKKIIKKICENNNYDLIYQDADKNNLNLKRKLLGFLIKHKFEFLLTSIYRIWS